MEALNAKDLVKNHRILGWFDQVVLSNPEPLTTCGLEHCSMQDFEDTAYSMTKEWKFCYVNYNKLYIEMML